MSNILDYSHNVSSILCKGSIFLFIVKSSDVTFVMCVSLYCVEPSLVLRLRYSREYWLQCASVVL